MCCMFSIYNHLVTLAQALRRFIVYILISESRGLPVGVDERRVMRVIDAWMFIHVEDNLLIQ